MWKNTVSNFRSDIDSHADEIRASVDNAASMLTLAVVGIGLIAVTALVVALAETGGNHGR